MNFKHYFVKVYRDFPNKEETDIIIEYFSSSSELLKFIEKNKDERMSVFESECVLDWT